MINHFVMSFVFPKVYPITDTLLSGLSHAEQVSRLIDGGATIVQLRDKRASPREFYQDADAALRIAREHNTKLIINDRVDVALTLKADGVHLGQTDLPPSAARRLLGPQAIIGLSTHNITQVRSALNEPVTYIAFGPVFKTTSKDKPDDVTGLDGLAHARSLTKLPLVAIGGINADNVNRVIRGGGDAAAIISAIVADAAAITDNFRKILAFANE